MVSTSAQPEVPGAAPVPCHGFLPRHDLARRLTDDPARLIVISAPTGCGKTMALASLAASAGGEVHWASLPHLDLAPRQGLLLIDDASFPEDEESQSRLAARLGARLSTQRIVICASKAPQPGPLVVFFAARARHLGPADLAFSARETAELFARPEDALEVEHWHYFTEGWPLGVALGAAEPEAALALMRWGGGERSLPRALAAVFETMSTGCDAALAMDLAGLGHFPLCVLQDLPPAPGRPRPKRDHLQTLLSDGLLLRDCDRRVGWLRFMPAYARFLEDRLQRLDPERATAIRAFGAEWSALNHDLTREMRHGLALWSPDETLRRLDQAGALRLSLAAGPDVRVDRPLDAASARLMPQAFLSLLYERIRHGAWLEARLHFDKAHALTEGFTRFAAPQDQAAIEAWVEVFRQVFRVAEDLPPDPEWHARLELLRRNAVGLHPVLTMALCTLSVIIPLDQGDRQMALRESEIGLQLRETIEAPRAALFVLLHRASALIASARLEEAAAAIEEASALAHLDGYADSYERVMCQIHAGLCAYERGEAARAYALLAPCASRVDRVHGWRRIWAELFQTLARLAHDRGGRQAAEDWLERGQAFALANHQPGLAVSLELLEVELRLREADLPQARARFDRVAARLGREAPFAPMIRHHAAILEIALLGAEGRGEEARRALDLIDRAAVLACDLRLHLRLEVLALGLTRDRAAADVWGWRQEDVQRLAARYPALAADPFLATRPAAAMPEGSAGHPALSPREGQILRLIVEGLSSKEIARRLSISEGTVKSHRKKIYEKLGVNMRSQAISRAREILGD